MEVAADAEASSLEAAVAEAAGAAAAAADPAGYGHTWLGLHCWGESTPPAKVAYVASEQSAQTAEATAKR